MTTSAMTETMPSDSLLEPVQVARRHIAELTEQLARIDKGLPSRTDAINALVETAYAELRKADEGLKQPVFALATVGTTSSGKSTLLNGILGRHLAPMDADEMSAGLLNITHSDTWGLTVRSGGDSTPVRADSEEAIYSVLSKHMGERVRARRATGKGRKLEPQPIFNVSGPLFPLLKAHDFREAVGAGVGFAVYDLPGLRTVNDPENLSVIKGQIRRAFSVVVIDRTKIFGREERDALLDELQQTVRDLGGKTSMMIFVLNKVDTRSVNDTLTIEEEAEKASREISTKLGLAEPVDVVPFSALAYYHAARLNYALLDGRMDKAQEIRGAMLEDCAQTLLTYVKTEFPRDEYRKQREIINNIEDDCVEGIDSSVDDLLFLARTGLAASGHAALWSAIVKRIEAHLPELIIYPQVNEGIKASEKLLRDLGGYTETQLIDTEKGLDAALESLESFREHIKTFVERQRSHYKTAISDLIELIHASQGTSENLTAIEAKLDDLGAVRSRFPELHDIHLTIDKLTGDLEREVLNVIEDHLLSPVLSSEIRKQFQPMVGDECAEALANAYEKLKDAGYVPTMAEKGKKTMKRRPKEEEKERFKKIERATADLFLAIRRALTLRSERFLNSLGSVLAVQVGELTRDLGARAATHLRAELIDDLDSVFAERISFSSVDFSAGDEIIELPQDVIQIPEPEFQKVENKNEVIRRVYDDPQASCFKGQLNDVKGDVEYLEVNVPSAEEVSKQLRAGMYSARDEFWKRFFDWFSEQCIQALEHLSKQLHEYLIMVEDGLTHRRQCLEDEAQSQIESWLMIQDELRQLAPVILGLSKDAGVQG